MYSQEYYLPFTPSLLPHIHTSSPASAFSQCLLFYFPSPVRLTQLLSFITFCFSLADKKGQLLLSWPFSHQQRNLCLTLPSVVSPFHTLMMFWKCWLVELQNLFPWRYLWNGRLLAGLARCIMFQVLGAPKAVLPRVYIASGTRDLFHLQAQGSFSHLTFLKSKPVESTFLPFVNFKIYLTLKFLFRISC